MPWATGSWTFEPERHPWLALRKKDDFFMSLLALDLSVVLTQRNDAPAVQPLSNIILVCHTIVPSHPHLQV